jgi:hypothetical protein
LFGLKKIIIGDFNNGIIPKFEVSSVSLDQIHRGISKTQAENEDREIETKKKLKTANDFIASINRRYNKFKYAYYNKGVERMNKAKITKCFQKTQHFLGILNHMHRKLMAENDPRAERFGKRVAEVNLIVQKYGAAIMRLNASKCNPPTKKVNTTQKAKPKGKIQRNSNKVRK